MLRHKTQEIRQVKHTTSPVNLVHAIGDVRRDVDKTSKLDFVTRRLEALSNLESDNTTITVSSDGVRTGGLSSFDGSSIARHHLIHRSEEGVARLEATSAESVEWTLVLEVFREVDEDKNLTDTRVHEEDGCLVAGQLEGNDGVVFLSLSVLREQRIDIVGQARDNGVLEDLDGRYFRQAEVSFPFALKSVDEIF